MTHKDLENLEMRLEYLAKSYEPHFDCKESGFKCDFRVDRSDECPCQWALKLNADCIDKLNPKEDL